MRTDVADPIERLLLSRAAAAAAKDAVFAMADARLDDVTQGVPAPLQRAHARWISRRARSGRPPRYNLVVSNVIGPADARCIAGRPLDAWFSVGAVPEGAGLTITAWSYADQLNISLLGCPPLLPDVWSLADRLQAAGTLEGSRAARRSTASEGFVRRGQRAR